jgi:hypothetical protein
VVAVVERVLVKVDLRSDSPDVYAEQRNLEYRLGSMPCLFQPPTPSATTNNCFDAKKASYPPLVIFSGCGIMETLAITITYE